MRAILARMLQLVAALVLGSLAPAQDARPAPAPLVVHDPFFSLWTTHARPTDGASVHASGRAVPMCVLARIDGDKVVRLLGAEPPEVPAPAESATSVGFTSTRFVSMVGGVELELAFVTPALPDDLALLARPLTYVELRAWSHDDAEHSIDLYFDVAALAAVEDPAEVVRASLIAFEGLETAEVRAVEVPGARGTESFERLERGRVLVSARKGAAVRANAGPAEELRRAFLERRSPQVSPQFLEPRAAGEAAGAISIRLEGRGGAGYVTAKSKDDPVVARAMIAYDTGWSVHYLDDWLPPFWRQGGTDAEALLQAADAAGEQIIARCAAFDRELSTELGAVVGAELLPRFPLAFARARGLGALCADAHGRPLLLVRDGSSAHAISSVDTIAALAPLQLLLSSDLTKALLVPILDRAATATWSAPFAPHALGQFPHAATSESDDVAPGPTTVTDSAQLILLVAALCQREGRVEFAARYWKQVAAWARFLEEQLAPAQVATHAPDARVNAALALAATGRIAEKMGSAQRARELELVSRAQAAECELIAASTLASDGDISTRLLRAFQWDAVLGLGLFSSDLRRLASERTSLTAPAMASLESPLGTDLFLRALEEDALWSRWFARGAKGPLNWAPAPLGMLQALVPDGRSGEQEWHWTTSEPDEDWRSVAFDDSAWRKGPGGFGANPAELGFLRTSWSTQSLWLRRTFELASDPAEEVRIALHLIGSAELWLNGVPVDRIASKTGQYVTRPLSPQAQSALRAGRNVLALRCERTSDASSVDAGLVLVQRPRR